MRGIFLLSLLMLFGCSGALMNNDPHSQVVSPPGNAVLSMSGFVNLVQLNGGGSPSTTVTFIPQTPQAGPLGTLTFCGDVVNGFVLNTFTTVTFTQGPGCSQIVSIVPDTISSASGVVTMSQLVSGASPPQTLVGLASQGSPVTTFTFCGDVTKEFKLDASVTVRFIQGQTCASIVSGPVP
jgi:hypothetical protein